MNTIGFIGAGNMAAAILKVLSKKNPTQDSTCLVYDIDAQKAAQAAGAYGAKACPSVSQLIAESSCIVLAVKPNIVSSVLEQNQAEISKSDPLIISIAAGKTLRFLSDRLPKGTRTVRVMPNINAKAGAAMSAYCCTDTVTDADKSLVETLFSAAGRVLALPESQFSLFTALAGSGPAYVYLMIDAMARSGVRHGMQKQTALEIAAQTVLGSAQLVLESGEHPQALIDQVCSPGGTTIEAVQSLKRDGFEPALDNAVTAALEKEHNL